MVMHRNVDGKIEILSDQEEKAIREETKINMDKAEYLNQRERRYKTSSEYLDMIWNTIDKGEVLDKTSDFYLHIKDVKDEFPSKRI